MLRSLDLFSGIGGISSAVGDLCVTSCYCDIDPRCRNVLTHRMEQGDIDLAPICPDVRLLTKQWLNEHTEGGAAPAIDIILAGVPCTGFSSLGKQEAFNDVQSILFFEMLRICDEFDPSAIFLENVSNIIKMGMHTIVKELFETRGYTLSWCTLSASDVGAPHKRNRWYCIAFKPAFYDTLLASIGGRKEDLDVFDDDDTKPAPAAGPAPEWNLEFDWDIEKAPQRMVICKDTLERQTFHGRMALLGNSVVPMAVRKAFEHVVRFTRTSVIQGPPIVTLNEKGNKTKKQDSTDRDIAVFAPYEAVRQDLNRQDHQGNMVVPLSLRQAFEEVLKHKRSVYLTAAPLEIRHLRPCDPYPRCGIVDRIHGAYEAKWHDIVRTMPYLDIDVHPGHYKAFKIENMKKNAMNTLPLLESAKHPLLWSTPRKGMTHTANILTERTSHDLPSQLKFEKHTPDHLRPGIVNPEYVEWMMGYPRNWTSACESV